jgi:DNA-binding response OmpR family regulator
VARVLFIEDDRELVAALGPALTDAGHELLTAFDGKEGLALVCNRAPDLVISDVNLPGIDGMTLVKRAREEGVTAPIILLTARDTEIDEALGLELGADDYIVKPFSLRILLARVAALLRRAETQKSSRETPRLTLGELSLDSERLELRYRGQPISVTLSEFRLLEALARRPGVAFSRDQLMSEMRGDDSVVQDRIIDTYVRRLRRKLEELDPEFSALETVVGVGYRLRDPDG